MDKNPIPQAINIWSAFSLSRLLVFMAQVDSVGYLSFRILLHAQTCNLTNYIIAVFDTRYKLNGKIVCIKTEHKIEKKVCYFNNVYDIRYKREPYNIRQILLRK